jgi:hypothetical protein
VWSQRFGGSRRRLWRWRGRRREQRTFGVDARTGKRVYEFPADGYTPAITDGQRVYLVGFEAVYGLDPK